ncbi:MAG: hypothetical protein ACLPX5_08425 [Dissulfurispiraceae bacterium]
MIILSKEEQIEKKRRFFDGICCLFGLQPSYVSEALLKKPPDLWADHFGGGIKGGRAALSLALAFARVACVEGNHQLEYQLSLAAAKKVITDEAIAYRDAWHSVLIAIEHCYQEVSNQQQPQYAKEMLRTAWEAVEDTDRRLQRPGEEKPSLQGQLDILVSKLSAFAALVGAEESPAVHDYRRRERNRKIRMKSGESNSFGKTHYKGIRLTHVKNRVEWFMNRYREKFGTEPPDDLFVPCDSLECKKQLNRNYYSLFDRNDYKQYRIDMHAKYRKDMGLPAKGEGWINQTFLLRCVETALPGIEILHEASPAWLKGQRLDIYIPSLKCAIEYQGEQHYLPLEHLGGEQGLKDRQEMDERKVCTCIKEGVMLIEWRYNEKISPEIVVAKLKASGISIQD